MSRGVGVSPAICGSSRLRTGGTPMPHLLFRDRLWQRIDYISRENTSATKLFPRDLTGSSVQMNARACCVEHFHPLADQRPDHPAEYITRACF